MADTSPIWYLENFDLFNVFCPKKVQKNIGTSHELTTYKKGDYIYFPEDKAGNVYLISDGRIKIGTINDDGKENIKSVLSKGEVFGEMALFGESLRKDFAQVLEEATLCVLTLDEMQELMLEDQDFSIKIVRLIGLKLRRAERKIESLVFKDARTRIIEFLLDLAEERGKKVGFETLVKGFFTHQDIANLTATSRQTVTTILNDLREQNLINFDRKRLLIRDVAILKEEIFSL